MLADLHRDIIEGRVTVRAPGFPGRYAMDIRSHVLIRLLVERSYEPEIVALVRERIDPARDAIDIGANVGLFTVLMASLLSEKNRVLAIEPTSNALELLRSNLAGNGYASRTIVVAGAASNSNGNALIEFVPGKEEYTSLNAIAHQSVGASERRSTTVVPSRTIDSLVTQYELTPGFLKIDTEGAEFLVLSGSEQTLLRHKPVIVSELDDNLLTSKGHSARGVVDLLRQAGYRVLDVHGLVPVEVFPFSGSIIAIPG